MSYLGNVLDVLPLLSSGYCKCALTLIITFGLQLASIVVFEFLSACVSCNCELLLALIVA